MSKSRKIVFWALLVILTAGVIRLADFMFGLVKEPYDTSHTTLPPSNRSLGTNSLGLRGAEIGPKDKKRILFLGDSFTMGLGVAEQDSYVRLSEQRLRSLGMQVEHVNGGISGYHTGNELGLFRSLRDKIKPDAVVLAVYVNDINEIGETLLYKRMRRNAMKSLATNVAFRVAPNMMNTAFRIRLAARHKDVVHQYAAQLDNVHSNLAGPQAGTPGALPGTPVPAAPGGVMPDALQARFFLGVVMAELDKYARELGIPEDRLREWSRKNEHAILEGIQGRINLQEVVLGLLSPDFYKQCIDLEGEGTDKVSLVQHAILRIKREADQANAPLLLVLIPSDVQYRSDKHQLYAKYGYELEREWLDRNSRLGEEMAAFAVRNEIPLLRLRPVFVEGEHKSALTYDLDQHLTPQGHALAANAISDFLAGEYLKQR